MASRGNLSEDTVDQCVAFYIQAFTPLCSVPIALWKPPYRPGGAKPIPLVESNLSLSPNQKRLRRSLLKKARNEKWHHSSLLSGKFPRLLTPSHLIGVLWRGVVAHAIGGGTLVDRLLLEEVAESPDECLDACSGNEVLQAALGDGQDPTLEQVRIAESAQWLWCYPGQGALHYVVVDLDVHDDVAATNLSERLALVMALTVKPHLIVRSRGGLGLHLFYFLVRQPWVAKPLVMAERIRSVLSARVPGIVLGGVLEVFPKGKNPNGLAPSYPFGPNSFLCDQMGKDVETHPLRALARWHQGLGPKWKPYTTADFDDLRVGPMRAATLKRLRNIVSVRSEVKSQAKMKLAEMATEDSETTNKPKQPSPPDAFLEAPLVSGTSSVAVFFAACKRLSTFPPTRGATNESLMHLARFLKYDCACSLDRAMKVLDRAVEPLVDAEHLLTKYRSQFQYLFTSATTRKFPHRTRHAQASIDLLLTKQDVAHIGRCVVEKLPEEYERRKAVLQLWLLIAGTARRAGHVSDECSVWVSSTTMQAVHRNYSKHLIWLTNFGGVERDGRRWKITLPKTSDAPVRIASHADLWNFLVENLPDKFGKKIADEQIWRSWKKGIRR